MQKCNTCGGTYDAILPDGMRYFHACAPLWDDQTKAFAKRANHRDENVRVVSVDDTTGKVTTAPKAVGKGTVEV